MKLEQWSYIVFPSASQLLSVTRFVTVGKVTKCTINNSNCSYATQIGYSDDLTNKKTMRHWVSSVILESFISHIIYSFQYWLHSIHNEPLKCVGCFLWRERTTFYYLSSIMAAFMLFAHLQQARGTFSKTCETILCVSHLCKKADLLYSCLHLRHCVIYLFCPIITSNLSDVTAVTKWWADLNSRCGR